MPMPLRPDLPLVDVESRRAWREWLATGHSTSAGVWAVTVKKGSLAPGEQQDRLGRLLADGPVLPAGLAAIDAAKADGSWSKLDALAVPDDLAEALDGHPTTRSNFDAFPPSTRRGILEWILQAKTEPTRAKRIDETARLAAENLRANQWPRGAVIGDA